MGSLIWANSLPFRIMKKNKGRKYDVLQRRATLVIDRKPIEIHVKCGLCLEGMINPIKSKKVSGFI